MRLEPTAAEREFLDSIRAFIARHWRPHQHQRRRAGSGYHVAERAWFEALDAQGWSVPHWPVAHGGTGWSPRWRYLWNRELALAEAPAMDPVGVDWAGPALCAWGDAAQQAALLPPIRAGRERWCLGLAESDPGAALAAIGMRGRRLAQAGESDDAYVVDGVKAWVAGADRARWMLALVHTGTDPEAARAAAGPSLLVIDLAAPGVEVAPLRLLDGRTDVCRITLTQVSVPVTRRLGPQGFGAQAAEALSAWARQQVEPAAGLRVLAARLGLVAAGLPDGDGSLADDPGFARKLAELGVELAGLEALESRHAGAPRSWETLLSLGAGDRSTGDGSPPDDPLAAVLRLRHAQIAQRLGELLVEAFGYYSLPYPDPLTIDNEGPIGHDYALTALQGLLAGRSLDIDGDASELLKNRIAKQVFGL